MTTAFARVTARAPSGEIVRFAVVGGGATLMYGILTMTFTSIGSTLVAASVTAYLASSACSFLGHRAFTFASHGPPIVEIGRFSVLNLAGLAASFLAPLVLTNGLGLSPIYATMMTCIVTPPINYLAMRGLVFCHPKLRGGSA
jgi:putative flippase GtrA